MSIVYALVVIAVFSLMWYVNRENMSYAPRWIKVSIILTVVVLALLVLFD